MGNNNRKGIGSFNYRPSSSGPKLTGIDSLLSNQAAIQKQDALQRTAVPDAQEVVKQLGGNVPVGSSFSQGGVTIPLNPQLSEGEQKTVAARNVYGPVKRGVQDLIRGGVLNSKKGLLGSGLFPNADRTARQLSVQAPTPLATSYDPQLQKLQSSMNKLKELMFQIGGTAFTATEDKILGNAFKLEGKNDEQILSDIELADALVNEKAKIALGGTNAAGVSLNSQASSTDNERQKANAAIAAGGDPAKIAQHFLSKTGQNLNG